MKCYYFLKKLDCLCMPDKEFYLKTPEVLLKDPT